VCAQNPACYLCVGVCLDFCFFVFIIDFSVFVIFVLTVLVCLFRAIFVGVLPHHCFTVSFRPVSFKLVRGVFRGKCGVLGYWWHEVYY
jgi:hypothetical protein